MVSWTNAFPLDPQGGSVQFFGRVPGTASPGFTQPWGYAGALYYLSGGVVDAQIGSRFQYKYGSSANIDFRAPLIFDAADEAGRAGRTMIATAYLAPASAVPAQPTIAQIRAAAVQWGRLLSGRTTAGSLKVSGYLDMEEDNLAPNTKWWIALVPTYSTLGMTISADVPIGDQNANGRAVSFWTNRTPLAPTITSPGKRTTVNAGTSLEIKFEPQGADRIKSFSTDGGPNDFDDFAGFHAQYAAVPAEGEEPVWMDMPFTNGTLAPPYTPEPGLGWFIDGASAFPPVEPDGTPVVGPDAEPAYHRYFYGPYWMWRRRTLYVQCGGPPVLSTNRPAEIPSGDWMFRVRTFDYGHPYPNSTNTNPFLGVSIYPALLDTTGSFTPESFPETNTSPWSEPIVVSIADQVPRPILLSPLNNIAFVENAVIALEWQYRNTLLYPGASDQKWRTVQIRAVGETDWITLADEEETTETTLLVPDALAPGFQYEWRVKTADDFGGVSQFSDSGFFWVVPEPDSGSVIPDPGEFIEGATLGCGTHRVEVYRRGGRDYMGSLDGVVKVDYGRVRDEISTAEIRIKDWGIDCGNLLGRLKTWAYEIVIYRDNGYESVRVWEGPITLLTYNTDEVVIDAKDVIAYLYRRIMKQQVRDSGDSPTAGRSVVFRSTAVVQNAFAPDDPNVLAYLQPLHRDDDAKQYRNTPAYSRTAYEEIDDMASNAGLDYTAMGRAILLWGTKHRIGTLPEFRDANLGNAPIVSEYGMSGSNVYAVSDGNGVYGEASRIGDDDNGYSEEDYGLVEMLSSTWASDSDAEQGTFTESGLAEVRQSFAEAADKSIDSRWPPPVVVRVPDNTTLSPDTVISINHLVPGVVIPLRSTLTLRQVVANQKLDSVRVTEENGNEVIKITMSPFSRDDNDVETTT